MRVKTFRAATMVEALAQIKREFGPNAVIIHTKTKGRGGVLGMGGGRVEITAARDLSDLPPAVRGGTVRTLERPAPVRKRAAPVQPAVPAPRAMRERSPDSGQAVLAEVGELKSIVGDLVRETKRRNAPDVPEELFATYEALVKNRVADELARSLVNRVRDRLGAGRVTQRGAVRAELAGAVEAMLPTAGPIRLTGSNGPTVIALVGPTGVGKTTTVAKLAANLRLREQRRVGLITIDTYRIAAVKQLEVYADIIDVPLSVAMTPVQLEEAIDRMSSRDVILIDTAGRGQRDARKLDELKAFFDVVRPHEVHLVLPSTGDEMVLAEAIDRFGCVGFNRVIFTKLDEAVGFGVVLACLEKADAALSYVTTGQDVPDDIEVGTSRGLANLVVPGSEELSAC